MSGTSRTMAQWFYSILFYSLSPVTGRLLILSNYTMSPRLLSILIQQPLAPLTSAVFWNPDSLIRLPRCLSALNCCIMAGSADSTKKPRCPAGTGGGAWGITSVYRCSGAAGSLSFCYVLLFACSSRIHCDSWRLSCRNSGVSVISSRRGRGKGTSTV